MIVTVAFAILLLIVGVSLFALLLNGIILLVNHIRKAEKGPAIRRTKKSMVFLIVAIILCASFVGISQLAASTPTITSENSIAELRQVALNGRKEWINIRGNDRNNPVLLFLAGGPGGSQMAAVRHDLAELEKHFVMVNWDQAGSGKSYGAMKVSDITVDTYIGDGYELTKYLYDTFGQEKIVLVGESWGSALGIFLIDANQ